MTWRSVAKSLQPLLAHASLFTFTIFLVLKLHHAVRYHWWIIFSPLWLFHAVVARGRFSLPAPKLPNDRNWAPFHAVMATPLLVAFELMLCIYLESRYVVSLKIVFAPLVALELAILFDNIRMCKALMPSDDEHVSDDVIWETLPHFWISISMVFLTAATIFTLLKINGDISVLGWWDLFINFGIAECFAFLVCTKWYNPAIHRHAHIQEPCSPSMTIRYLDWNSGLVVSSDEDQDESAVCSLQDIGGHIMKIPLICFQILLFMHLEGRPSVARHISIPVLFTPLLLLQGAGVLFAAYRLTEKILLLVHNGVFSGRYLDITSKVREYFGFFRHGSRFWVGGRLTKEVERNRLDCIVQGLQEVLSTSKCWIDAALWYDTFSPDIVKKLPRSDLVQEIWKLQAALSEQTEITKFSQQEYERLQNLSRIIILKKLKSEMSFN
ncbi:unnamed protein product [Prunus armeniaca]|uniref:Transmembrane Fragile-X-F-associated protein n=1 Tax=Prunus armeniaca TaxID=36596 RepID=A0A6J5W6N1_PRUAR|nr:unnamed protein product [Prunus armeniaca]